MSSDLLIALGPAIIAAATLTGVFLKYRSENVRAEAEARKAEAEAGKATAETDATLQDTYQEWVRDLRARLDEMAIEMSALRDSSRHAVAAAKEAQAEAARFRAHAAASDARLAEVQAELAVTIAKSSEERHTLKNELAALAAQLHTRELEIAALREELDTLRAQVGVTERRGAPDRRRPPQHP